MDKNTTICCGSVRTETAAYGGWFSKIGFVAVFSTRNEVGINENISVGYKGEFNIGICGIEYILHSDIQK